MQDTGTGVCVHWQKSNTLHTQTHRLQQRQMYSCKHMYTSETHVSFWSWCWGVANLQQLALISATSPGSTRIGLNLRWLVYANLFICVFLCGTCGLQECRDSGPKLKHGSGHQWQKVKQQDLPAPIYQSLQHMLWWEKIKKCMVSCLPVYTISLLSLC